MLHDLENVVRSYLLQLGRSHLGNCPHMCSIMLLCFLWDFLCMVFFLFVFLLFFSLA